jgi:hypothetical protein
MTFDPWRGYAEAITALRGPDPDPDYRGRAFDLAAALDEARILAHRAGGDALDHDLVRALTDALSAARLHAISLVDVVGRISRYNPGGWERFTWCGHMTALARDVAHDVDDALDRVRALDLDHALDLNQVLGFDLDRALYTAADHARSVASGRPFEATAACSVGSAHAEAVATPGRSRSATRLLHGVLWMLPPTARDRYREELDSELAELVERGEPRRAQLGYALRTAGRMWSLRRALRKPPSGDGQAQ